MREKLIPKVLKGHKACMLTEVLWPLQNTFVSGRCQELKQRKGIRVSDISKYIVTRQPLYNEMKNSRYALHNNICYWFQIAKCP